MQALSIHSPFSLLCEYFFPSFRQGVFSFAVKLVIFAKHAGVQAIDEVSKTRRCPMSTKTNTPDKLCLGDADGLFCIASGPDDLRLPTPPTEDAAAAVGAATDSDVRPAEYKSGLGGEESARDLRCCLVSWAGS